MTKMARVLITEQLAQPGIELLRSKGHDVQISLDLSPDDLSAEIAEADALIVRSATQVDKRLLDEANRLQVSHFRQISNRSQCPLPTKSHPNAPPKCPTQRTTQSNLAFSLL